MGQSPAARLLGILGAVWRRLVPRLGRVTGHGPQRIDPAVAEALVVPGQTDVDCSRLEQALDLLRRELHVAVGAEASVLADDQRRDAGSVRRGSIGSEEGSGASPAYIFTPKS